MNKLVARFLLTAMICCFAASNVFAATEGQNKQLLHKAKTNDVQAMYELATNLFNADGIKADYKDAAIWFFKAAEKGSMPASISLADCYSEGLGAPLSFSEAHKLYEKGAEANLPKALYKLGEMYAKGYGVKVDNTKAVDYYKRAAELGCAQALSALAVMNSTGNRAIPQPAAYQSYADAAIAAWFAGKNNSLQEPFYSVLKASGVENVTKALEKVSYRDPEHLGDPWTGAELYNIALAHKMLHELGEEADRVEAMDYFTKSANLGYVYARQFLADDCMKTNNPETAIEMLKDISKMGSLAADASLLKAYAALVDEGKAGYEQALVSLGQRLTKEGYLPGMVDLANYYSGKGKSPNAFMQIVEKAANLGDGTACIMMSDLYYTGKSVFPSITAPKSLEKAYSYLSAVLEGNYPMDYKLFDLRDSFSLLGNMYYYGKGTKKNFAKAEQNYKIAIALRAEGCPAASLRLANLYLSGNSKSLSKDAAKAEARTLLEEVVANSASSPENVKSATFLLKKFY